MHRILHGEILNEFGTTRCDEAIDEVVQDRTHQRVVPLVELALAEHLGYEVAMFAMFVAIETHDELTHELTDVFHVDRRCEQRSVAQHRFSVLPVDHHVTTKHGVGGVEHAALFAGAFPDRVGLPMKEVERALEVGPVAGPVIHFVVGHLAPLCGGLVIVQLHHTVGVARTCDHAVRVKAR